MRRMLEQMRNYADSEIERRKVIEDRMWNKESSVERINHYLESNFDLFGQRPFRKDGLDSRDNGRSDDSSFRTNGMNFLTDSCDDSKIIWKVGCNDSSDSIT